MKFSSNYLPTLIIIFFSSILIHCPKEPELSTLLNQRLVNSYDTSAAIDIYFTTLRKERVLSSKGCSNSYYSSSAGAELRYGSCKVNVPAEHNIGSLDQSVLGSKDKFFQMMSLQEMDASSYSAAVNLLPSKEIIVFVHGFNVPFEEAIYRAAQIKYDIKFPGSMFVYSWAAGEDSDSFIGQLFIKGIYETNFQNAINSRASFRAFLDSLDASGKTIHLIVHSMGHQIVLPVLAEKSKGTSSPFIKELILNAPDYDYQEFNDLSQAIKKSSNRVTLYCSKGDNALIASQKVNGKPRAGMCGRFPGMDVINVNEVDDPVFGFGGLGHGYYSSRPILTDIYQVLLGIDVEKRLFIRKSGSGNSENFVIRK
ncbi:alpha/beta hydrolase [Leptospira sp. GIMC2001]|uniref:alpha/beta hydrolase n=1 Tax=Leptospira sp. GIMC2001 TaxID=1513297 RepID=UPI00234BF37F|nr:alpha/beta hydrolase [Leptospira sp. GIMC2001]WCL50879.1 alpha/beta hydrolase [Leptospira sp. GIMC2001]